MRIKKRTKTPIQSQVSAHAKKILRSFEAMSSRTLIASAVIATVTLVVVMLLASRIHAVNANAEAPASASAPAAADSSRPRSADALPADVADAPVAVVAKKAAPVTITGCLERNDDKFRLKDTIGDEAPKARSWKSGFFKKSSASVDLVDASNRAKLGTHVGQRVSVTGTLVDREMQVRSVQRVALSCSTKS